MQSMVVFQAQNRRSWKGVQSVYSDRLEWSSLAQLKMEQCSLDDPLAKAFFTGLLLTRSPEKSRNGGHAVHSISGSLRTV
jgi:hypothetical protein